MAALSAALGNALSYAWCGGWPYAFDEHLKVAFAVNILIIHLFGDVISPPLVGWVDDRASLRDGLYFLAAPMALAGLFWLWGKRHLDRDTAAAPTRMAGAAG